MTGDLQLGGHDIVGVGLINGIDLSTLNANIIRFWPAQGLTGGGRLVDGDVEINLARAVDAIGHLD